MNYLLGIVMQVFREYFHVFIQRFMKIPESVIFVSVHEKVSGASCERKIYRMHVTIWLAFYCASSSNSDEMCESIM